MFIKTKARTKHQSNSYYAGKCLLGGGVTKEETEGGEPCSLLALPPSDLHSIPRSPLLAFRSASSTTAIAESPAMMGVGGTY